MKARASPILLLRRWVAPVVFSGVTCSNFLALEEFDALPPLEQLDFSLVQPNEPYELWELRQGFESGVHRALGSGGTLPREAVSPVMLALFDATQSGVGFAVACLPGYCYKYFISLRGSAINTWSDAAAARAFLGSIDNPVEAALLVQALGYYWGNTKEEAAVRRTADGFEVVALALIGACAPVRVDRFVLLVSSTGAHRVLRSQVWREDRNACI